MSEYAVMPINDYKNTCDKVREKTGTEETIKSGELAGEVEKVFEAGKEAEIDRFWKSLMLERNSARGFLRAVNIFRYWNGEMFYPPKNTTLKITAVSSMFSDFGRYYNNTPFDLVARLEERNAVMDFSACEGVLSYAFYNTTITRLPLLNFRYTTRNVNYTFDGSNLLESIEKLIVGDGTVSTQGFRNCSSLIHLILEVYGGGKIKKTWDFSYTKLDPPSMKSIILCLFDYSGTDEEGVYSILFPEPCWEALEADSVAPDGGTWGNYVLKLGYLK